MNLYEVTLRLSPEFKFVGRVEAKDVNEAREIARKHIKQNLDRATFSCQTIRSNSDKRYQVQQIYEDLEAGTPVQVTLLPQIYKDRKKAEERARNLDWSTQPPGMEKPISRSRGKVIEVPA